MTEQKAIAVVDEDAPVDSAITLADFLETHPPGSQAAVRDLVGKSTPRQAPDFLTTDIQLHCPSPKCGGTRIFHLSKDTNYSINREWGYRFLTYHCRNCAESFRTFSIRARATEGGSGEVYKIGEFPPFGPPLPSRVMSLVGPERDLFLKGRRAENQGLGIGAFTYYRRVVESQWKRLVAEIVRVAERVGAPGDMVTNLQRAGEETQFRKAVALIKEGVPEALRIRGQNPLTLLYAALSEGIHDEPDEYCLELAGSIRVVLTELAERIGLALKDEQELNDAVTRLLARKQATDGGSAA